MRFPVTLDVRPSRRLRAALLFLHLIAIAVVWLSAVPPMLAAAISAVSVISLYRCCGRQGAPVRLRLCADGSLARLADDGEPIPMELLADATVYRWLVVIRLRAAESSRAMPVVVLADSLSPGDFRLLRIWLRWLAGVRTSGERA